MTLLVSSFNKPVQPIGFRYSYIGRLTSLVLKGALIVVRADRAPYHRRSVAFLPSMTDAPFAKVPVNANFVTSVAADASRCSMTLNGESCSAGKRAIVPARAAVAIVKSQAQFDKEVVGEEKQNVVVMVYARWCRLCEKLKPRFVKLARENPNIKFVAIPYSPDRKLELVQSLSPDIRLPYGLVYRKIEEEGERDRVVLEGSFREFEKFNSTISNLALN